MILILPFLKTCEMIRAAVLLHIDSACCMLFVGDFNCIFRQCINHKSPVSSTVIEISCHKGMNLWKNN